jgi:hypothetical protein
MSWAGFQSMSYLKNRSHTAIPICHCIFVNLYLFIRCREISGFLAILRTCLFEPQVQSALGREGTQVLLVDQSFYHFLHKRLKNASFTWPTLDIGQKINDTRTNGQLSRIVNQVVKSLLASSIFLISTLRDKANPCPRFEPIFTHWYYKTLHQRIQGKFLSKNIPTWTKEGKF